MDILGQFFVLSLVIQILHAIEELATGFHKKWYAWKMPFWVFFLFELVFEGFWILLCFLPNFPNRSFLQGFFLALMFANGVQHIVWAGNVKKYVPGLVTAPLHIIVFFIFYFRILI